MARGRCRVGDLADHQPVHPSSPPHAWQSHPLGGAAARIRRYVCPVSFTHPPEERPFAGSVALVTGAARRRGIGRATALGLARGGADVACLDIARPYADAPFHGTGSDDDLASLVAEISALGVRRRDGGGRRLRRDRPWRRRWHRSARSWAR